MEVTPDMMAHKKSSVLKWVERHTAHYRSTGVKFENALDWVTQTRYEKSSSEISNALDLGASTDTFLLLRCKPADDMSVPARSPFLLSAVCAHRIARRRRL